MYYESGRQLIPMLKKKKTTLHVVWEKEGNSV